MSQALRGIAFAVALLVAAGCSHTPQDVLVCRTDGLAGISYGQQLDVESATLDEVTSVGVRYYAVDPSVDISPFETMLIGVTPTNGRVFSIRLERHGDAASLDRDIALIKTQVETAYPSMAWQVIGNHHHAERIPGLDLTIYRLGDLKGGRPSHLLSYDCDNIQYRKIVIDEARTGNGQ